MWLMIIKGGWLMLPILLCSFFALAIIIERLMFYFSLSARFNTNQIKSKILEHARQGAVEPAIEICEKNLFHVTSVLKTGLANFAKSKDIIREAMEDVSLYEVPKLEKNLHFLSTIAHISPLLGLLGTVLGLVKCFYIIEQKASGAGVVNPSDLAGGIWEALLTTVAGLCVAIPAYIAYNYFVHKVNFSVREMEHAAIELLEIKP